MPLRALVGFTLLMAAPQGAFAEAAEVFYRGLEIRPLAAMRAEYRRYFE